MSFKFKLRKWLNVDEAAQFLCVSTGEDFNWKDIASLVVEGTLTPYWNLYRQPARMVVPYTKLLNFWPLEEKDALDLLRERFMPEFMTEEEREKRESPLAMPDLHVPEDLPQGYSCHCLLTGNFLVPPEFSEVLKSNLTDRLWDKGGDLVDMEGPLVADEDGTLWQLLDYMRPSKQSGRSGFYYPSDNQPMLDDLAFLSQDVKSLLTEEDSLAEQESAKSVAGMAPHWGEGLQILVRAARRFWENADPTDSDTYPKPADIAEWLRQEGIPDRVCKSAPQLLRPYWANQKQ